MEYAARFDCSEHGFGAISIEKIYPARAGIQKKSALIFPSLWQAVKQLADQYNQAERQRAKVAQTRRDMDSISGINNFDRSDLNLEARFLASQ
jgi:hypothetical protein